jgi:hypothetical protein
MSPKITGVICRPTAGQMFRRRVLTENAGDETFHCLCLLLYHALSLRLAVMNGFISLPPVYKQELGRIDLFEPVAGVSEQPDFGMFGDICRLDKRENGEFMCDAESEKAQRH